MNEVAPARPLLREPCYPPAILVAWGTNEEATRAAAHEGRERARMRLYSVERVISVTAPTRRSVPPTPAVLGKCVARKAEYGRTWWLIPARTAPKP